MTIGEEPATSSSALSSQRWPRILVLIEGLLGFFAGAVFFTTWQICVEPAQVMAGLVTLPAWNPEYRQMMGTWTLLSQLSALGLRAGINERALSIIVSGLAGSIWFSAIALLVFALCRRPAVSVVAPFFTIFARTVAIPGTTYSVFFIGQGGTYGVFGLAVLVLTIALFACEETRWAGFVAALMPAVHPSLGVWLGAVLLVVAAVRWRWFTQALRSHWRLWVSGSVVTAASFLVQRIAAPPPLNDANAADYFAAFIRHWDTHRRPFPLWSSATAEVLVAVAACLVILVINRNESADGRKILAISGLATAVLGLGFSAVYWLPPENVPRLLLALMPSRLINFNIAIATPIVLGLLAGRRTRHDALAVGFMLLLLANATFFNHIHDWEKSALLNRLVPGWPAITRQWGAEAIETLGLGVFCVALLIDRGQLERLSRILFAAAFISTGVGICLLFGSSVNPVAFGRYSIARIAMIVFTGAATAACILASRRVGAARAERIAHVSTAAVSGPSKLLSATLALSALLFLVYANGNAPSLLHDRTNSPFWRAIAAREGTLIIGPTELLVQLKSRRPVLLNAYSLDYLPFTEGTGPGMDTILKNVYGVDLLHPSPAQIKHRRGGLLRDDSRGLWERRGKAEWSQIAQKFGATDLLCSAEWQIRLPRIAAGEGLALYAMRSPAPGFTDRRFASRR